MKWAPCMEFTTKEFTTLRSSPMLNHLSHLGIPIQFILLEYCWWYPKE